MKTLRNLLAVGSVLCLCIVMPLQAAQALSSVMATPRGLSLLELKVTGEEFIVMYNNTDNSILDLSSYWLTAFNNVNPLAAGVSSSSQQLPAVSLLPAQSLLLSASPMKTCGASVAGKLSLSLNDSGGFMQLTRSSLNSEGAISQTSGDFVSWHSGAGGIIQNLPSNTKSPQAAYYRYFSGNSYAWQQADLDATDSCQLNLVVAGGPGSSSAVTPLTLATTSPPATILGIAATGETVNGPSMPSANIGLLAPQISELLPNPVGTGNDSTDEFIELYNPNAKPFELTGFSLETGLTTMRDYLFPDGTTLEPNSFRVFYAADTKLMLSNTSSQAALVDPFGNAIASSDIYKTAKDGVAWVNAKNTWQWTIQPTPGIANVVKSTVSSKSKAATKKKATSKKPAIKGLSTIKSSDSASSSNFEEEATGSTVHTGVLALIGGLALLYGAYEYRRDITNRLYQLRAKLSFSRTPRKTTAGR